MISWWKYIIKSQDFREGVKKCEDTILMNDLKYVELAINEINNSEFLKFFEFYKILNTNKDFKGLSYIDEKLKLTIEESK